MRSLSTLASGFSSSGRTCSMDWGNRRLASALCSPENDTRMHQSDANACSSAALQRPAARKLPRASWGALRGCRCDRCLPPTNLEAASEHGAGVVEEQEAVRVLELKAHSLAKLLLLLLHRRCGRGCCCCSRHPGLAPERYITDYTLSFSAAACPRSTASIGSRVLAAQRRAAMPNTKAFVVQERCSVRRRQLRDRVAGDEGFVSSRLPAFWACVPDVRARARPLRAAGGANLARRKLCRCTALRWRCMRPRHAAPPVADYMCIT